MRAPRLNSSDTCRWREADTGRASRQPLQARTPPEPLTPPPPPTCGRLPGLAPLPHHRYRRPAALQAGRPVALPAAADQQQSRAAQRTRGRGARRALPACCAGDGTRAAATARAWGSDRVEQPFTSSNKGRQRSLDVRQAQHRGVGQPAAQLGVRHPRVLDLQ